MMGLLLYLVFSLSGTGANGIPAAPDAVVPPAPQATAGAPKPTLAPVLPAQNGQSEKSDAANSTPKSLWEVLLTTHHSITSSSSIAPPSNSPAVYLPDSPKSLAAIAPEPPHKPTFFDRIGSVFQHLEKATDSSFKVHGSETLSFQASNISGSQSSYLNNNYFGAGSGDFYHQTDVTVQGRIAGLFNFQTHYTDSPFSNPNDNRFSINYNRGGLKFDAGSINGSISGNSLMSFNRYLNGIQLSYAINPMLQFTTLYSATKAQPVSIQIPGNNTAGPYYVYAGQIVDGSAHVRVDNQDMVEGKDFTLDPYTGELNFLNRIVAEGSTIAVSFETYGYNQSAGTITGDRLVYGKPNGMRLGITYLAQTTGQSNQLATKTEQFYGNTNPQTPYELSYPIQLRSETVNGKTIMVPVYPVTVTVNGVPQVYNVDYTIDPVLNNRIYFNRPLAGTDLIKVIYIPAVTTSEPGNSTVMGFDTTMPMGKLGHLTAEFANSSVNVSGQNVSDRAWQILGDTSFLNKRLHWTWNLHDIGANYTSIETPGFQQSESGFTTNLDYQASRALRLNMAWDTDTRPNYTFGTTSSVGQVTSNNSFQEFNLGANWTLGKGILSLTHSSMNTDYGQGTNSGYVNDNLSFNYTFLKSLNMVLGFSRQVSSAVTSIPSSTSSSSTLSQITTDSATGNLGLRWQANPRFTLSTNIMESKVATTGSSATTASNIQFNSQILPMRYVKLNVSYSMSDSGATSSALTTSEGNPFYSNLTPGSSIPTAPTATNSFLNSPTLGSGGTYTNAGSFGSYSGAFNSGLYNGYGVSSFGGNSRSLSMDMTVTPSTHLGFEMVWSNAMSEGGNLFNSTSNSLGFMMNYSPSDRLAFNGNYTLQNVNYIGSIGGTTTNLLFLSVRTKPFLRLTASLGYQLMNTSNTLSLSSVSGSTPTSSSTSSASNLGTNLSSFMLRFEYPVFYGSSLFYELDQSITGGYLAGTENTQQIGISFGLGQNISLSLGVRDQQQINADPSVSGYSYHVTSLDATLNSHF